MKTSVLTRRQRQILVALADGQALHVARAYPNPTRYRLGPDFLSEEDVRKLLLAKLIETTGAAASARPNLNEWQFTISDAGRAMLAEEGRR